MPAADLVTPYITGDLRGVGGRVRVRRGDFVVEEVPLFTPSGVGDHLYVNVTKEYVTTRWVQRLLASVFDVDLSDVGFAGLKDKDAVATQTFSVFNEHGVDPEDVRALVGDNVVVNWVTNHDHKFRSGYIRGNRFRIIISDLGLPVDEALVRAQAINERVNRVGVPNFYGEQRMGRGGKNVVAGWRILRGEKELGDKWLRRYLISAYQSYLCNVCLTDRVIKGCFTRLIEGDIVSSHSEHGFWVSDLTVDQPRFEAREVSFTVPMFGPEMMPPSGEAGRLEDVVFQESGLSMEQLRENNVTGSRRLGRLVPRVTVAPVERGLELRFTLGKGGYATTLLREYMKK